MSALKPCPFCGGLAMRENTVTEYVIRCLRCRVSMTRTHHPEVDSVAICACEDAWNTRHDEPRYTITEAGRALLAGKG